MDGNDYGVDLDLLLNAVEQAEVLIIRFPFIAPRLLIDMRQGGDGPVIALVPRASAIEERAKGIKQARPSLPLPERVISFEWPRHAELLRPAGLWERIVRRFQGSGFAGAERRCDEAWRAMQIEERREAIAAIRGGEHYESLWERESSEPS